MNLLKFKIELLVDMVTLANLDCDKLEAKGEVRARCRRTLRARLESMLHSVVSPAFHAA